MFNKLECIFSIKKERTIAFNAFVENIKKIYAQYCVVVSSFDAWLVNYSQPQKKTGIKSPQPTRGNFNMSRLTQSQSMQK